MAGVLRMSGIMLLVYGGFIGLTYLGFARVPTGFIPPQDKGYLIVDVQMPEGASLERTDAVIQQATKSILSTPGVTYAVGFAGFSAATLSNNSGAGAIFVGLKPFEERQAVGLTARKHHRNSQRQAGGDPGGEHFRIPASLGLGSRNGGRLQAAGARPIRRRPGRAAGNDRQTRRRGESAARTDRALHAFSRQYAANLHRCGPDQG